MSEYIIPLVVLICVGLLIKKLMQMSATAERDRIRVEQAKQKIEDAEAVQEIIEDVAKLNKSEAAEKLRKLRNRMLS